MKLKIYADFCGLALLLTIAASAQQHRTGEKFDTSQLTGLPVRPIPTEKAGLPVERSLRVYCPDPVSQNGGTCFAYSSAFAGRSILYNRIHNLTTTNNKFSFSPGYLVANLQPRRFMNAGCSKGYSTIAACQFMQTDGVVPLQLYPEECSRKKVTAELRNEAAKYKVRIRSLFKSCDPVNDKVFQIKQSLSDGYPVVIGLTTMASFNKNQNDPASPDLWKPTTSELSAANCYTANHAICIVGYSDTKYGGVFEIINSWGTGWKDGGFTYVAYNDLAVFLSFGIELSNE